MLKTKIIEHYKPPAKTLGLLNSISNIKLEIIINKFKRFDLELAMIIENKKYLDASYCLIKKTNSIYK